MRFRSMVGRCGRDETAFTVVELLVVMSIILVLAGLILATSSYVHNKGARSRAEAEIAAMSAALENYKADNGVYPVDTSVDPKTTPDPASYAPGSLALYKALSGDADNDGNRSAESTAYMSFKPNQLYPPVTTNSVTYIKDPFGYSYGYSTIGQAGTTGFNPTFDLWSTAGGTSSADVAKWIKNW
ncbi:MAG: type II secretion system GspH family protein [Verrucomicrobiota bacterium]|nr:type II secretion system GspH family protein [Verrucomicrobiota bacterium]